MDLYTKLSAQMEEVASSIHTRMAQYEEDLKAATGVEAPHKTIASLSREFNDFKNFVCKTLHALSSQTELLMSGLDRHEMASRRKVLLVHGTSEKDDPLSTAVNIFSNKLDLSHVTSADVAVCHRLGTNKSKPRPLLIRFHQHNIRNEVWKAKTLLKGSGLTVTEFLTKARHKIFMEARRHFGIRQAWTSEGKITVQLPDQTRRKIETASQLRELLVQFPVTQPATEQLQGPQKSTSSQPTGKSATSSVKSRRPLK